MIRPPYFARIAAGAAAYVLEETRKIPGTAVTLPMTAFSKTLQTGMHFQQFITSLAIRGDQVFGRFLDSDEPQPAWASFDEDQLESDDADVTQRSSNPGRFALYSMPPNADEISSPPAAAPLQQPEHTNGSTDEPEIAQYLAYGTLTLVQLRARLRSLSVDELTTLLDYEDKTLSRAPFQTMLANRIASAKAK
ncbi:lipid droplet-associated protein [Antrihabitans cavernicola]|uniref:Lipid droplet-associated protein n=1 Tax=Antrihabitans cavernicola TaxID=2495913 RepID=A0A5A7SCP9_9NOCA|nr:lipid droplet-associated protein [Spelaeibacter cavernicola]KAA0023928.1 lipid droplet-associated protein [Spelaeibacter cavernicola]